MRYLSLSLLLVLSSVGCARHGVSTTQGGAMVDGKPAAVTAGLAATPCVADMPTTVTCFRGNDGAGAHVMVAMPSPWNGELVVHAHGGPPLEIKTTRADEDLTRWSIWPRAGYAYVASVFREPGLALTSAADDTERARRVFVQRFGKPQRTWLHGQSWGAGVAAKTAERYATPHGPYDGVLLTSGVLAGGTKAYGFRVDLRVVYQALCQNHPKPTEVAYPLWQGLPVGEKLSRVELTQRVNDCLALNKPAAQRSQEQLAKIKAIVDVIRIPESSIQSHLAWATWNMQDLVSRRTGGLNPHGNEGVRYRGSSQDEVLNHSVQRFKADPIAVQRLAEDADLSGRIPVPVLSLHGVRDATAFVEHQAAFRDTMTRGGSEARLAQVFVNESNHSYWNDATYVAALDGLRTWVQAGTKASPTGLMEQCSRLGSAWQGTCAVMPAYQPQAWASRVPTAN